MRLDVLFCGVDRFSILLKMGYARVSTANRGSPALISPSPIWRIRWFGVSSVQSTGEQREGAWLFRKSMSDLHEGLALLNLLAVLYEDLEALAVQVYGCRYRCEGAGLLRCRSGSRWHAWYQIRKLPRRLPARRWWHLRELRLRRPPIILPAKPSSGTFSMAVARPVMGLEMMVVETTFSSVGAAFSVAASVVDAVSVVSATFSSSKVSGAVSR